MARAAAIRSISTSARYLLAAFALACSGCGSYADFTLPPFPVAGSAPKVRLVLQATPVMGRGDWDSSDVLNPSIVERDGHFFNFYSGFDGKVWRTGLAESADGAAWTKHAGPVLSPDPATWESNYIAANGSALLVNGEFWYWYQAGARNRPQIGLARSKDGIAWTKLPAPVLQHGPKGSFDEVAVADPYLLRLNGTFYMYYLGQDRAQQQRLGLARSMDGVKWEKLRSNPLLPLPAEGSGAFDENGQGEPAVFAYLGRYWLLWTGRDAGERRALGMASSFDGVHWTDSKQVIRGREPWNASVVADPTVLIRNGVPTVWFGGGDKPSPDEGLHGQIGIGKIELVQ